MSTSKSFERGPLREYEITWLSGHVETIEAHQVSWSGGPSIFGNPFTSEAASPRRIQFMGEFDGQWTLVLQAQEDDIRTVRDVTTGERIEEQS